MWTSPKTLLPAVGRKVLCRLKNDNTGAVQEHWLRYVAEDDCSWRTADDNSEISYNWTVIEWLDSANSQALKYGERCFLPEAYPSGRRLPEWE